MLNNITNTQTITTTAYIDISNKVKEVKHSVVVYAKQREELEESIVAELYSVFTHKAS